MTADGDDFKNHARCTSLADYVTPSWLDKANMYNLRTDKRTSEILGHNSQGEQASDYENKERLIREHGDTQ